MNKTKKKEIIDYIIAKEPECNIEISGDFATCRWGLEVNLAESKDETTDLCKEAEAILDRIQSHGPPIPGEVASIIIRLVVELTEVKAEEKELLADHLTEVEGHKATQSEVVKLQQQLTAKDKEIKKYRDMLERIITIAPLARAGYVISEAQQALGKKAGER